MRCQQRCRSLYFLGMAVLPSPWKARTRPGKMEDMGQSAEFGKFLKAMRSRMTAVTEVPRATVRQQADFLHPQEDIA